MMNAPFFVLRVRAEEGVDEIHALRAWLKIGLRTFGLRCVEIQEDDKQRRMNMDMRQYASTYIKPDNVRTGPIQTRIIHVSESTGKYRRPVLELEIGSQFTLNEGNTNTLIKAWGYASPRTGSARNSSSCSAPIRTGTAIRRLTKTRSRCAPSRRQRRLTAMAAQRASLRYRRAGWWPRALPRKT